MRESITQEFEYGCGIACYAFALHISYQQAAVLLGPKQALSNRFWIKDFTAALNDAGLKYYSKHINDKLRRSIYEDGTIVLIDRSKKYSSGHYLIRYNSQWMDPWINLPFDNNINNARSGFRKKLPGIPMYALYPGK